MIRVLRRFLYLDAGVVDEFIAQIEGGLYGEEAQRIVEGDGRELGGEAGLGGGGASVKARAGRKSSSQDERERTVQQTPESRFNRLYDSLESEQAIQWLEALDEPIWDQLRRGEIVEVDGVVALSSLNKLLSLLGDFAPLLGVVEALGEPGLDAETAEAMQGLGALAGVFGKSMPIIVRAGGSPKYKFVGQVSEDHMRVELGELEGEATMLAKLQRKLGPSEKYTPFDSIPAMAALPRSERNKFARELKNDKDLPDLVVSPPAAVVTPIAVYR
jgi:hypothetical protein